MKKFIVFAVVMALLVPAAAFADGTEFSLGGFIKLDAMWDSNKVVSAKTLMRCRHATITGAPTMGG